MSKMIMRSGPARLKRLARFIHLERKGESTFAQFEKKMGISASTLHRIELGQQNVTLDTLEVITDRIKVSVGEIFGEVEK